MAGKPGARYVLYYCGTNKEKELLPPTVQCMLEQGVAVPPEVCWDLGVSNPGDNRPGGEEAPRGVENAAVPSLATAGEARDLENAQIERAMVEQRHKRKSKKVKKREAAVEDAMDVIEASKTSSKVASRQAKREELAEEQAVTAPPLEEAAAERGQLADRVLADRRRKKAKKKRLIIVQET
jgi:hypothetical protein